MDNKLSELSKPVGYFTKQRDGNYWPLSKSTAKMNMEPLYSQEYVSALLAELEAKDERIGELEVIATDYAGKFQKAQDANKHLIIMSNDDKKRIAELSRLLAHNIERSEAAEAKLATPVRLPNKNDDEFWFDNVFQVAKFDRAVERAIRAAGFTVEGDE
ncbi:hypothetical protein L7815_010975 [Serratia marcescens]|uniref:hypothetical protein n=1 Tax=Serratia marcescens TaxID=615 RepID=UPI001EE72CD8|nr:hypothetical protein [Serratia marcescens]MCG5374457.1 hypothetical protein [Serratia marcescens]